MELSNMSQWEDVERRLQRVRKLAQLMDDKFAIPGTRIRFGLDSLVGLFPGAGDAATAVAGLWLIVEAARLKAPRGILVRMGVNLLVDSTLGVIPVAGDVFDLYWKSNRRNAALLEEFLKRRNSP
ncbi:MAG: DUF4112 domain-containing protein [Planctomycetales bacterium]|nr:DUF4112 domain-containing protein [Planctomycetales bacterium]